MNAMTQPLEASRASAMISQVGTHVGGDAPRVALQSLDTLWFQVGGTVCNLACTHCFVSCLMNASYSAAVILPALSLARADRTSAVCGKEPMVVVGYVGSFSNAACLAARVG